MLKAKLILLVVVFTVGGVACERECSCGSKSKPILQNKAALKAATAALTGTFGTAVLSTSAIGFTSAGIAAGSLAAFIQGTFGTFAGFSLLQSLGATGALSMLGPVGLGAGLLLGGVTYWLSSSSGQDCDCESDRITEEEYNQFFALKSIESCIEPATSKGVFCNRQGTCFFDKDNMDLFCKCERGYVGTYCEIFQNDTSNAEAEKIPSTFTRCSDEFIRNCTQCMVKQLTLNSRLNCHQLCNWNKRAPWVSEKNKDLRQDVGELEMIRVSKLRVQLGTECVVQVNDTCTTVIKYTYEHTSDYLDKLVVYFSTDEITCKVMDPEIVALTIMLLLVMIVVMRTFT